MYRNPSVDLYDARSISVQQSTGFTLFIVGFAGEVTSSGTDCVEGDWVCSEASHEQSNSGRQ